jgi:uncharacterized membrane protein YphA (DoxX/SURF4 family)
MAGYGGHMPGIGDRAVGDGREKERTDMDTATWTLQIVLAALFLPHGILFLLPAPRLRALVARMGVSPGLARFLGVAEVLGAIGLIAPRWTGILPWLTPLAGLGLVVVMVGAIVFHLRQQQAVQAAGTVAILALVAVVVAGTVIG